jgi:hypothetical protein
MPDAAATVSAMGELAKTLHDKGLLNLEKSCAAINDAGESSGCSPGCNGFAVRSHATSTTSKTSSAWFAWDA